MTRHSPMNRDHYSYWSYTPGSSRATAGAPARSRETEDALHDGMRQSMNRLHTSLGTGAVASVPPLRRMEDEPFYSPNRSRTPRPVHVAEGYIPHYDLSSGPTYTSSVPPGRGALESRARPRETENFPYDGFRHMSLTAPPSAPRLADDTDESTGLNTRFNRGTRVAFQEFSQHAVEHNALSRSGTHLHSRSIGHANTTEQPSSWIPPHISLGEGASLYAKYDFGDRPREQARDGYQRDTTRTWVEDFRGRSPRRQSSNENVRPRSRTASARPAQRADRSREGPVPRGERPEFIVVGLFVLRLGKRMIEKLDSYPERSADLAWLDNFLSCYSEEDDLTELRGRAMDEFAKTNPVIINHFIRHPRFPIVFMQMDPTPRCRKTRRLTDEEARDMVDFSDAAAEWGSNVKLPGYEQERMEALAARRRLARDVAL